jgi:hypothetical protein
MADPPPFRRPTRWHALRADEAERVVREWAQDTARVFFSGHAFDRIEDRSITQDDAYWILRTGFVEEAPVRGRKAGEWKVIVARRMPGGRRAGLVTLIVQRDRILDVITVEWMDVTR